MEQQSDFVSREELDLVVSTMTLQAQKTAEILSVAIVMLASKCGVTQPEFEQMVERTRRSPTGKKLDEALEKLRGFEAIHNVLKNFEGPLQ